MKNAQAEARFAELGAKAGTPLLINHTKPGGSVALSEQVEYFSHELVGQDLRISVYVNRPHRESRLPERTLIVMLARNVKSIDTDLLGLSSQPETGARVVVRVAQEGLPAGTLATVVGLRGDQVRVLADGGREGHDEKLISWEHHLSAAPVVEAVAE